VRLSDASFLVDAAAARRQMADYGKKKDKKKDKVTLFELDKKKGQLKAQAKKAATDKEKEQSKVVTAKE